MNKREILDKLLALAQDNCNKFESERAYQKFLKLKAQYAEDVAIKKANEEAEKEWNAYDTSTWSKEEQEEYNYWHGGKFSFERTEEFLNEIFKVDGGYLIRRWNYLCAMSYHFKTQLNEFGYEYEGVRKNCIKQISFFEHLKEAEFGQDEYDEHSQPWYKDTWGKFTLMHFQGNDTLKMGNPKINYLMFVDENMVIILENYWHKDAFKNAKNYSTISARIENK